ncbi:MAG: MFS transporter [Alistipes sp.]|jgi:FSR family fosmidomycin resistance protein-like MFS transporter|uniref:MFS transporter n=1 Tax=uncultured Alistipes sp. TaxID=538949 RepID=UPI0025945B00|nr:MFS transporter [uncultured Alistipes sp.]MCI9245125.1 MFS transporter [Alistipes sp.]
MRSASPVSSAARVQGTAFVVLFVIGFAHLLNDMIQSVVPAVYPLIKEKFGLSFAQIGIITLVFQLTSSILQPFVGRYADRHPRPYSLFVGMCFTLVGLCALAVAPDFRVLVAAVSIIGFGSSIFHPEASQVAQLASGGRKGLAQSIFQVGGNGGTAVGPLLAALVVVPYGQGAIGWFSLAAIVAAVVLVRVGKWYSRQLAHVRAVSGAMDSEGCGLSRKTIRRAMAMLIVLMFSKHFYIACINSYFTFFLIGKFGVSVQASQFCLFAFLAASAVGTVAGGFLGDRFGRKYVIWGSILGAAPFALALPYTGLQATIVLSIVIGLVISSAFSAILVYATDLMPGKVGMIAGIFFGLSFGLGGIGSAFFGWLADRTGVGFIFRISSFLPLLGVVAGFLPDLRSGSR